MSDFTSFTHDDLEYIPRNFLSTEDKVTAELIAQLRADIERLTERVARLEVNTSGIRILKPLEGDNEIYKALLAKGMIESGEDGQVQDE